MKRPSRILRRRIAIGCSMAFILFTLIAIVCFLINIIYANASKL